MQEWVQDLKEELAKTQQKCCYFEIGTQSSNSIHALKDWMVEQAAEKYEALEKKRYLNHKDNNRKQ